MPRETLDRLFKELQDELLILSSMVEEAVLGSVEALKRRDMLAAKTIYDGDRLINARRFALENLIISTLATQQPVMAGDLRRMASLFEVTIELERMGDYAKGIAKICLISGNQPPIKPLIDIPLMAEISTSMLHRAIEAFIKGDVEQARAIPEEDNKVDELYIQVYRELVAYMLADPTIIDRANYLMWAAHNLERLADRVTNICERTIYNVTGKLGELQSSDDEMQNF